MNLTNEQQFEIRANIASKLGWTSIIMTLGEIYGIHPITKETEKVPDYFTSDSACREMREAMTIEECYLFNGFLCSLIGPWKPENKAANWLWHATPTQQVLAACKVWGIEIPEEKK